MTDREHPAMEAMEATRTHTRVDGAEAQPGVPQLVEVHDPVLRLGEPRDPRIRGIRGVNVLHVNT
jgi:hypothetical protein